MLKINYVILFGIVCLLRLDFVYSEQEANHKTVKSRVNVTTFAQLGRLITFLLQYDVFLALLEYSN